MKTNRIQKTKNRGPWTTNRGLFFRGLFSRRPWTVDRGPWTIFPWTVDCGLIIILITLMLLTGAATAFAGNLIIENVSLVSQDAVNDTYDIKLDISWDGSWYTEGAPSLTANWDAAWVFAKYSVYSAGTWSDWAHLTLSNTGYTAPSGSQMSFGDSSGVYKGVFIYRASDGAGSVDWNNARIKWNYAADGVADGDAVKIKLFAIEMVYVPTGSFYVGDTDNTQTNSFYEGGTTNEFQITSEAAITVADTAGNLYYDADNSKAGDQSGPIPAAFPKGYNAFYIIKYEVSQRQYTEFLNTLTSTQAATRDSNNYGNYRNYIKLASNGKYGSDANNNAGAWGSADYSLMNESNDGEWIAANYTGWTDLAAYADWAALRPFTELEYEKAARGGQPAVNDEYFWGNTTLETATTSLINEDTASEVPDQGNLNYSSASPNAPYRVGSFADATSSRTNAGAGYYGVLDLGGSLWEKPVPVGISAARDFTGTHGDGSLSTDGNATNSDWPGYDGLEVTGTTISGNRGGNFNWSSGYAVMSNRNSASSGSGTRQIDVGIRVARTAP